MTTRKGPNCRRQRADRANSPIMPRGSLAGRLAARYTGIVEVTALGGSADTLIF
jgi:hypothetical protein